MNAERLRELVDSLLEADDRFELQTKTEHLVNPLQALAGSPADTNIQSQVVQTLATLDAALKAYIESVSPATREAISSIGASEYFTPHLVEGVKAQLAENGLTPAVVAQDFTKRRDERQTYLERLRTLSANLEGVGIRAPIARAGTAELGVMIPRELFHNELDPLAKELHTINRILSLFSKAVTGNPPTVEVHQISTTDPTFFLGLDVTVVAVVAGSITWLLNTLKQAIEIKEIWSKAKSAGFDDDELKIFEAKAEKLVDRLIEERVQQILSQKANVGRDRELKNGLVWAHHSLLARIERGMTIDVRFLPPPEPEGNEDFTEDEAHLEAFDQLAQLAPQIEYPKPTGEMLLKLPSAEPPKQAQPKE